jgi:16S rRNA (guanine527-N7)-methyltransferase
MPDESAQGRSSFLQTFQAEARAAGLESLSSLPAKQQNALADHYLLMERWNRTLNLTRVVHLAEAVRTHYIECCLVAQMIPEGIQTACDLGTGAGFPGIPVAILRPEIQITLVESHKRKAVFLREATRELPNVKVWADRMESLSGNFEIAVSRAVDPADVLRTCSKLAPRVLLMTSHKEFDPLGRPIVEERPLPYGRDRILILC